MVENSPFTGVQLKSSLFAISAVVFFALLFSDCNRQTPQQTITANFDTNGAESIGAAIGGAGGTATALATKGDPAVVAPETSITFSLIGPDRVLWTPGDRSAGRRQ